MSIKYLFVLAICFFSGCSRYYKWGKSFFVQADERSLHTACIQQYHTYVDVYDGFNTVALFDILWMSDEVWEWYEATIVKRFGATHKALEVMRKEQEAETSRYITFYLLMTQPQNPNYILPQFTVENTMSSWSMVLGVGDQEYQAQEIKTADLSPELQDIFGYHYNRYRNVYRIRFDRYNIDKEDLLADEAMELRVRSIKHEVDFVWNHSCSAWRVIQSERSLI